VLAAKGNSGYTEEDKHDSAEQAVRITKTVPVAATPGWIDVTALALSLFGVVVVAVQAWLLYKTLRSSDTNRE